MRVRDLRRSNMTVDDEERLVAERDAARAEVARLRAVVDAARALSEEAGNLARTILSGDHGCLDDGIHMAPYVVRAVEAFEALVDK